MCNYLSSNEWKSVDFNEYLIRNFEREVEGLLLHDSCQYDTTQQSEWKWNLNKF